MKSEFGEIEISVPRDRNGEYEPKLIPKHSRSVEGLEDKIISLYAAGMSTYDVLHPKTKKPIKKPDRGWRWNRETLITIWIMETLLKGMTGAMFVEKYDLLKTRIHSQVQ